jgi:hypothetical protein
LPSVVMRRFAIQLLLVLDFAHDHNVIHTGTSPLGSPRTSPLTFVLKISNRTISS